MSGKFIKGFLIFAVVFFFVVVGLVGLTVVMKRHENAQIAEENKTLVAPDPQKIQQLVDRIEFDEDMSEMDKVNIRQGVNVLLKSCPRIAHLASSKATLSVADAYGFTVWDKTKARFDVIMDLKINEWHNVPSQLRTEEGYAGFGLVGGEYPGVLLNGPFDHWLCNVPYNMTYKEMLDAHNKKKVPYKDMMHFLPLKDIPPNSF